MSFILLFHILVALLSGLSASFLFFNPSRRILRVSYTLLALTTGTGVYLILGMSGDILGTCLFGLSYISILLFGIVASQRKLTRVGEVVK